MRISPKPMKYATLRTLCIALCVPATSAFAQAPDLNQLKSKMQQLEQMMHDLRQEIASVEQSQKPPGAPLVSAAPQTPAVPTEQISNNRIVDPTRLREPVSHNSAGD